MDVISAINATQLWVGRGRTAWTNEWTNEWTNGPNYVTVCVWEKGEPFFGGGGEGEREGREGRGGEWEEGERDRLLVSSRSE